jgi:hypothetical protein
LDRPENIKAIYDLLSDIDISGMNFQAERPITELYQEIKNMSVDKELMFLHHKVDGFERPQEFKGSEYYQDFRGWLADNGFTDYKAKDAVRFGMYMKKVAGVTVERRTANVAWYTIDPLKVPQLS